MSLFCLEIHGEECNEEDKIVTASVACEWWSVRPQAMSTTRELAASHITLACSRPTAHLRCILPHVFLSKRETSSLSMSSTKKFACNIREQLLLYRLDCDEPFQMDLAKLICIQFALRGGKLGFNVCVTFPVHALHLIQNLTLLINI